MTPEEQGRIDGEIAAREALDRISSRRRQDRQGPEDRQGPQDRPGRGLRRDPDDAPPLGGRDGGGRWGEGRGRRRDPADAPSLDLGGAGPTAGPGGSPFLAGPGEGDRTRPPRFDGSGGDRPEPARPPVPEPDAGRGWTSRQRKEWEARLPKGSTPDRQGPWGDDRSRVQHWRMTWSDQNRAPVTAAGEPTLVPRRTPSVHHKPEGRPEELPSASDRQSWDALRRQRRDIERQNRNATVMAQHGFDVRMNPSSAKGSYRPADWTVNGHLVDHKVPDTDNAANFVDRLDSHAQKHRTKGTQAARFAVDLDGRLDAARIRSELLRHRASLRDAGLDLSIEEVVGIRGDDVVPIYPLRGDL